MMTAAFAASWRSVRVRGLDSSARIAATTGLSVERY
jgi:hypothetical protein